jgi:hypothetical protein
MDGTQPLSQSIRMSAVQYKWIGRKSHMAAIAPSSRTTTKIILEGVAWPTFKALMAEMSEDRDYRIAYVPGQLQLENIQPNTTQG